MKTEYYRIDIGFRIKIIIYFLLNLQPVARGSSWLVHPNCRDRRECAKLSEEEMWRQASDAGLNWVWELVPYDSFIHGVMRGR